MLIGLLNDIFFLFDDCFFFLFRNLLATDVDCQQQT